MNADEATQSVAQEKNEAEAETDIIQHEEAQANDPAIDIVDAETDAPEDPAAGLQAKVDEYREALQRERAEFINYKRRVERERADNTMRAKLKVLAEFLPVIDDFERAMENIPEDTDGDWFKGVEMISRKFKSILTNLGVEEIDALGQPFDPNFHEAIGQGESDEYESGHVMNVLQRGYRHGDNVLRPAMVQVAA